MMVDHPLGTLLEVWVVPGARSTEVVGPHGDALKVRVAAPPEGGRANVAMLSVLAERLGVDCRLVRGDTRRRKTVLAMGLQPGEVANALGVPTSGAADDHEVPR